MLTQASLDETCAVEGVRHTLMGRWLVARLSSNKGPATGVSVEAIGAENGQQLDEIGVWLDVASAIAPVIPREQHSDACLVELANHCGQAWDSTWHGSQLIDLVAVVHAQIRVRLPEHHAVDATVPLLEILEEPVDCPAVCFAIVKKAVAN